VETRIIVVSNREVVDGPLKFGEQYNAISQDNLRVAMAARSAQGWTIDLLPESRQKDKTSSETLFEEMVSLTRKGDIVPQWVVFVHGFNTSFPDSLEHAETLRELYGVNVLLFSWPSNPGPDFLVKKMAEYQKARVNAVRSGSAFDRLLEKLGRYVRLHVAPDCPVRFNLITYSQGNYLLESYIRLPIYGQGETELFDNLVLCSADVDAKTHKEWVSSTSVKRKIYVTINENDKVLSISNKVNPTRLGQTTKNLDAIGVVYMDFTDGKGVNGTHRMFDLSEHKNKTISLFFNEVLNSRSGERIKGITYNEFTRAYEVV